ncbi:antA/AntB antirepressor family protein, partial [Staphylococcus aureus]|uniref:antA/AntB antirepressor family protein n=1 Tax=Staphylococcus aureus TaxID=1280 RepID=UPI00351EAB45
MQLKGRKFAHRTKSNIVEMFNIQEKENGEIAISGRELHQALEVKTPYKKWFERMSDYGLFEGFSMGNPRIQTGNLLVHLKEYPTSILIEAEESKIPEIK